MNNEQILLAKRPKGMPGEDTFKFQRIPLGEPKEHEVLLKTLYISVDPYMRARMDDVESYIEPFEVEKPISGRIIGEVIKSKDHNFNKGDVVVGATNWQKYSVVKGDTLRKLDPSIPYTSSLGIVGMTGLTAYFGLLDIGRPKEGETVVISAAAGAVGSVVGQIAKMQGCHVVGIAGDDEKINFITEELGFDSGINYKTVTDLGRALREHCPNGIDIYFDNVGGEISDVVHEQINNFARIVVCGQIALYNTTEENLIGPRVGVQLIKKSALMQGFVLGSYEERFAEGIQALTKWVKEGKLKEREHIVEGFENTPKAFIGLFTGENIGKLIVKIAEESHP